MSQPSDGSPSDGSDLYRAQARDHARHERLTVSLGLSLATRRRVTLAAAVLCGLGVVLALSLVGR